MGRNRWVVKEYISSLVGEKDRQRKAGKGVEGGLGEALQRPLSPLSRYDDRRIFSPEKERKRTLLAFQISIQTPCTTILDRGRLFGSLIRNAVGFIARLRARSAFKYPLPTVMSSSCDDDVKRDRKVESDA